MQAIASITIPKREQAEQARMRALVRFNGLTFHSLAIASFLETAVPLHVSGAAPAFGGRPDVTAWLEQAWWPQRAELGRRLREYVEATWPEFDWGAAYQEFYDGCRSRRVAAGRRGGATLRALGLCAAAAQAALFYRALARCGEEPALRELARGAAAAHADGFDYFRALVERCQAGDRVGLAATWRALTGACRDARDHDVAAAFACVRGSWRGAPVVPELTYADYRLRMARLIRRHTAPGPLARLLFRPWLADLRAARSAAAAWPRLAPETA